MCTKNLRKLLEAVMPHVPQSLREERLKQLIEAAEKELKAMESVSKCMTYTKADHSMEVACE